jgi:DNA-binding NtrC family response regulator
MSKRILIVDDEVVILLAFQQLLAVDGRQIDTAETIEEAERLLDKNHYDVVIADLRLTGILGEEGLEILQYVREKSPGTRMILVTGYGSPEIKEKAYELGAAFYFEKPVSTVVLKDALQRLEKECKEDGSAAT